MMMFFVFHLFILMSIHELIVLIVCFILAWAWLGFEKQLILADTRAINPMSGELKIFILIEEA